jgi:hypothetical protein
MLGGAVGLPTSAAAAASAAAVAVAAHKQFHPNSPPLDLDSWKEVFLQQANTNGNNTKNNEESSAPNNDHMASAAEDSVSSTAGGASGGAINLSSRPSSHTPEHTSGNSAIVEPDSQEDQAQAKHHHTSQSQDSEKIASALAAGEAAAAGKLSPLQALFSPPGLQQMQQFLQHVVNNNNNNNNNGGLAPGFNPTHLQHFMQQSNLLNQHQQLADAGRKQLEQLMHQLQEQLQINLLQQTHLMQTNSSNSENSGKNGGSGGGKSSQAMQQLQIQQQQLISQLQLVQQRLLMLPSFNQRKLSDSDFENKNRDWKENGTTSPSPPKPQNNRHGKFGDKEDVMRILGNDNQDNVPPNTTSPIHQHPLFQHGVCQWPGCDSNFNDLVSFLKHVGHEHVLDDKSTAQARVQMQIVAQLEHSLGKERDRLQAMMAHLHLTKEANSNKLNESTQHRKPSSILDRNNERSQSEGPPSHSISPPPPVSSMDTNRPKSPNLKMRPPPVPPAMSGQPPPGSLAAMQQAVSAAAAAAGGFGHLPSLAGHPSMGLPGTPLSALHAAARGQAVAAAAAAGLTHPPTSISNHMRRRMVDKVPPIPMSNGLPYMFDRAGLDIAQEIHRNREFYRTNDVRPPFTYASLIRQAVMQNPKRQPTLHEIYNWFTDTFAYFRGNVSSWKVHK